MKNKTTWRSVKLALVLMAILCAEARADSTIDPAHPYAYGANAGWINAQGDVTNGAVMGQAYCTGYVWSANCGWICLGHGPTNGWQYSNASGDDWGVNHDGMGKLWGCAYGANVGWIVFEQTNGQPRIDLRTGNLSGYFWGANIGWVSLTNTEAYVRTATLDEGPDSDADGIADAWEMERFGNLTNLTGSGNIDNDNLTDCEEYLADTDPFDADDWLGIVTVSATGGMNIVVWNCRPTRQYRLETTNSLDDVAATWPDAVPGLLGPEDAETMTQTVASATATGQFYRVQAIMPLSE